MHSTDASDGRHAAMDDSGTVVVAATNARLASVAAGLSLVTESAAAYGRSASSMVSVCQSRHALSRVRQLPTTSRDYCELLPHQCSGLNGQYIPALLLLSIKMLACILR